MSVGMPTALYLAQFADIVRGAFGEHPYLVGSCLTKKTGWRDVDVRLILDDAEYAAWGFGEPAEGDGNRNERWWAFVQAFSELGRKMTGLPIDFQIQQQTYANKHYGSPKHLRSALGMVPHRFVGNVATRPFTEKPRRRRAARPTGR